MNRDYATTENPNGKYKRGTVIRVDTAKQPADVGTFVLQSSFIPQPNGDAYFQWVRLGKNGRQLSKKAYRNYRSGSGSWLDRCAVVVSEPSGVVENIIEVQIWHSTRGSIGQLHIYKDDEIERAREIARKWFDENQRHSEGLVKEIQINKTGQVLETINR